MYIVDPSYEILSSLDAGSAVQRIEACGRICYKSEDKITEDSAEPFVKRMLSYGHNSVMEMAVLTLRVRCDQQDVLDFFLCQPKFLEVDQIEEGLLITASVRAYREIYRLHPKNAVLNACMKLLCQKEELLFSEFADKLEESSCKAKKLSLAEVDALEADLAMKHRFVVVRFITTRAVTHELVRHRPCSFLQESQRYCRYTNDKFGNQVSFIKPLFYKEGTEEYAHWLEAMEETEKLYFKLLETSTPQAARTVLPNSCRTEIITFCNLREWQHIFSLRTTKQAEPSMREVIIPLEKEMQERFSFL